MKRLVIFVILALIVLSPQVAFADVESDLENKVHEGLGSIDFSQVEQIGGNYVGDVVAKIQQIINGQYDDAESFWDMLKGILFDGFYALRPQLASIFVILVLVGLVRKTSGGFISQSTDDIVSFVGISVIMITTITLVVDIYKSVQQILDEISALANASLPIILTLVIANGSTNLSAVCQPSMVMFSGLIISVVQKVVLPLSMSAMAFSFVSNLSANVRVSKMSDFLNKSAGWLLGIMFTVFSAFTSVQGISASVVDGVTYRMAKFSAKNYIPILGGYVADGFDVVVASTSLIKNAFGVVLLVVLAMMIVKPLMSIVCINIGLQAVTAFSQPVVDEKCTKVFDGVCKSLTFLSALVIAVAFMFVILVFIAICCANGV